MASFVNRVPPGIFYAVLAAALLASFLFDCRQAAQSGAIDLRNRITGARLLETGRNPYTYKWSRSEPEAFCDPYNNPLLPVSKTTATPALLLVQAPFAALPYPSGRPLWFAAQWTLWLGSAWLWWRQGATEAGRRGLALFAVAFTWTAVWRLHSERGQAYVLLLFLSAGWLALQAGAARSRGWAWAAGALAGFLGALRPTFLLLLPYLALRRREQLPGWGVGLAAGVAAPLLLSVHGWNDYFAGMSLHSFLYRNGIDPDPPPQAFPPTVEGMPTDLLGRFLLSIPYADSSAYALLRFLGLDPSPEWIPPALLGLFGLLFAGWLAGTRRRATEALLPGLAAFLFLADFVLPAYRNSYNDVLILNVAALAFLRVNGEPAKKKPRDWWTAGTRGLLAAALLFGIGLAVTAPRLDWVINLGTLLWIAAALSALRPSPDDGSAARPRSARAARPA